MRINLVPAVAFSCLVGVATWLVTTERPKLPFTASQGKPLPPLPQSLDIAGLLDAPLEETLYGWLLHRIEAEDSLFYSDREILMRLPPGYLELYATRTIEELLEEGGISRLMGSVDRRFLPDAVRAYRRFGASEQADLLLRAQRAMSQGNRIHDWHDGQNLSKIEENPDIHAIDIRLEALRQDVQVLRTKWIGSHLRYFLRH